MLTDPKLTGNDELVSLVGWRFHTFRVQPDGCRLVEWQGIIEAKITDRVYMVMLFDWFTGSAGSELLVPLDRMIEEQWEFYQSAGDQDSSYELLFGPRADRHEKHLDKKEVATDA